MHDIEDRHEIEDDQGIYVAVARVLEEFRQAGPSTASREGRRSLGKTWPRNEKVKRDLLTGLVCVWLRREFPHLIEALVSQMEDDFESDPDVGFCAEALRGLPQVTRKQELTEGTPRTGDDDASGKHSSNADEATPSLSSASLPQSIAPPSSSWGSERSENEGGPALENRLEMSLKSYFPSTYYISSEGINMGISRGQAQSPPTISVSPATRPNSPSLTSSVSLSEAPPSEPDRLSLPSTAKSNKRKHRS